MVSESERRVVVLDNGFRIVTDFMAHVRTVSLGVWLRAGSRNEDCGESGIAHFLEHMAFKGTESRSAYEISRSIEDTGGDINAGTGLESTSYYARLLSDHVGVGLDILSDIVCRPVFLPDEIARERGVVLQEISASHDSADEIAFDAVQWSSYPDQALGRPILGTSSHVSSFGADDLRRFRDRHYCPGSMVLSISGVFDHDRVVDLASSYFSPIKKSVSSGWRPVDYVGGERRVDRDFEQCHLALSFPGVGYLSPDYYAFRALSVILGGGMSSRLSQEVREKRGLCYSIFSFSSCYHETGLLQIYAATSPSLSSDLCSVIFSELGSVCEFVGEDELLRARAQIKAGLLMGLEGCSGRSARNAYELLYFDGLLAMDDVLALIDKVTVGDVCRVARLVFLGTRFSLGASGDVSHLPSYSSLSALL